ncbi:MAG TPA: type II toxin-antitoxin system ParD family antitoxin [Rhizomicrobium sp.]|jgi:antitoxin ParD1/3/4
MPISVDLGKRLESTVAKLVARGRYNSKSEVLREGVRLVEEREKALAELDAALDKGLADIKAGRIYTGEQVLAETKRRIREAAKKRA